MSANIAMIEATLAFVFNQDLTEVLLMEKTKPVHHAGQLNGLGGKLELSETHLQCVVREVNEEAGIFIPEAAWLPMGEMSWDIWQVSLWTTVLTSQQSVTFPEPGIAWYQTHQLPKNIISNLAWLVPLAQDINRHHQQSSLPRVKITYH